MKNYILFLSLLCSAQFQVLLAQDCGTDLLHSKLVNTDDSYSESFNKLQNQVFQKVSSINTSAKRQQYVIPVVVHVFHLGEPEGNGSNISDNDIYGAIQGVNDRFSNAIGNSLDIELEFCLASRSPDGCPTDGINRVDASFIQEYVDYGIGDFCNLAAASSTMKDLSKWPVSDYYNIWVVHKIPKTDCSQTWGGYANYPYGGSYDGTVMRAGGMNYNSLTLAHELGHGFNLQHTFNEDGGDQYCPDNTDCLQDGDRVCDTPPHKQSDCGPTNPCTASGIWDNSVNNYMSYCFPSQSDGKFTQGQKDRIIATLQSYPRDDLLNSNGCSIPSLNLSFSISDASCDSICDASISVNANCAANYTYLWSTGDTTQIVENLCVGTYSVTVTNTDLGIPDSSSALVDVVPLPSLTFSIPESLKEICEGDQTLFLSSYIGPSGGVFSGNGVGNGVFYPEVAGVGKHVLTYHYPNASLGACAAFVNDTVEVLNCIGIDEQNILADVKIAPNPTVNQLNIEWSGQVEIEQINIFDFTGKQVKDIIVPVGNVYGIDVSNLAEGIYFIQLNESGENTYKFIKLDEL